MSQQQALEFFEELLEIHHRRNLSLKDRYPKLRNLLERICKDLTKSEALQFSNLFSRIVFLCNKYNFDKRKQWQLQHFRIKAKAVAQEEHQPDKWEYLHAVKIIAEAIAFFYQCPTPESLQRLFPRTEFYQPKPRYQQLVIDKLKVEIIEIQKENQLLICKGETNEDDDSIRVKYNVEGLNEEFTTSVEKCWVGAQLNLIEVRIDEAGHYVPKFFVLEPDFLIDVSGIAECFQSFGNAPQLYLHRKFDQVQSSPAILLGNIANFFLDELLNEDHAQPLSFEKVFPRVFRLYPFEFTALSELEDLDNFRQFKHKAQTQYLNIDRVLKHDLIFENIQVENCYLEPSFYSEKFGIQGRLDFLHRYDFEEQLHFQIVELKSSGSVPNRTSNSVMWNNHFVQASLYRMLIQSVFAVEDNKIRPAIFYSTPLLDNLRFAPKIQQEEKRIINLRNHIVATEYRLASASNLGAIESLLTSLRVEQLGNAPVFITEKIAEFNNTLKNADSLEKKYFYAFVNFVCKEQQLARIGDIDYDNSNCLASLWLTDFNDKKDSFSIFYDLEIQMNNSDAEQPHIVFKRTNPDNDFVNFREGDIGVLYPRSGNEDSVLKNQIFKCSISSITKDSITVRFRYKQKNKSFFEQHTRWAIEHDLLDNTFTSMYRGLFSFLKNKNSYKKKLLLGLSQPMVSNYEEYFNPELNSEQNRILSKALSADDYFLLVGPPGTGKTSIILRNLTKELYKNPENNLLLLAYTNRAVDEICDAICEIDFVRIGSEFSTAERHREKLLDRTVSKLQSRAQVKEFISKSRVFVSTVASISGKQELFKLKKFNVAIIDEASQILEPQIIGILPLVEKFILIGDHKQLPAIVLQDKLKSRITDRELIDVGLENRANSYFERIFNVCRNNKWEWAYDTLTYQGRMHREIAEFPNLAFYDNVLKTARPDQNEALHFAHINAENPLESLLATNRMLFIPTRRNQEDKSDKINSHEARLVAVLVKAFKELYEKNNKPFDAEKTIGIITPYRNQIAHIRNRMEAAGIAEFDRISVDTVERYQGSQRDIIIVSFCINSPYQVKNLVSLTDDGKVDRKLNVALTRARQQMIFLGNEQLLCRDQVYEQLIDFLKEKNIFVKGGTVKELELQEETVTVEAPEF